MKKQIIIIILIILTKTSFCQSHAFIYIEEENSYPYESYTKNAQKHYSWTFNGKLIKYKTGKYEFEINGLNQFDTIRFQEIVERKGVHIKTTGIFRKHKVHFYDTITTIILCKFRENHNYNLSQIFPGNFEIYSLDTFETKKKITFKLINKNNSDTFFLRAWWPENKIFCDTTLIVSTDNEKMKQSFVEHIEFNSNPFLSRGPEFGAREIPNDSLFVISYLYLHAENLEIEYNFATKQYKLRLLN